MNAVYDNPGYYEDTKRNWFSLQASRIALPHFLSSLFNVVPTSQTFVYLSRDTSLLVLCSSASHDFENVRKIGGTATIPTLLRNPAFPTDQ